MPQLVADFLRSPMLAELGVPHGFSLRTGGMSEAPFDSLNLGDAVGDDLSRVAANHERLLSAIGVSSGRFAGVRQVHGTRVLQAVAVDDGVGLYEGGQPAASAEADALIATEGTSVGVRTADCVPILLHDPVTGLSAAVHAGWRGTVGGIAALTVETLTREYGVSKATLRACIGPAIGACCFEVGEDVARHFDEAFIDRHRGSKPRVDLPKANRRLLERAGLSARYVEVLDRCTFCHPEAFFSHRRDAGRTGRHLAVIAASRRQSG